MSDLWISTISRTAHPSSGGHEVYPARVAIELTKVRDRLERSRVSMERHRNPPPVPLAAGRPIEGEHLRHRRYLDWSRLLADVEQAIASGEDMECDEFAPLARGWCGRMVVDREFAEVVCSGCERSYPPDACVVEDWSSVAGPRAGVGGLRLECPEGHTLYVHQSWVA